MGLGALVAELAGALEEVGAGRSGGPWPPETATIGEKEEEGEEQ